MWFSERRQRSPLIPKNTFMRKRVSTFGIFEILDDEVLFLRILNTCYPRVYWCSYLPYEKLSTTNEYCFAGIFNKDITCEQPKYVSGCNIVNRRCRCERSKSCADDSSPFSFKTRQECQLNLKSMLTRPDDDEDDQIEGSIADDEGKKCKLE
ncbi:hypothetical protein V9T40_001224 [Parthenolecanium corni]|uniref:Uncharacterized protein n=1 Tax=Parthenolecanium corni TaxID=536013 RepID=A0AAN9TD52_9HEMI